MLFKTTLRYRYTPTDTAKIKKTELSKCWGRGRGRGASGALIAAGGNIRGTTVLETPWMGSYKAKSTPYPQSSNPTTRNLPKRNESMLPQKDLYKQLFHYIQNLGAIQHSSTEYFLTGYIIVWAVLYSCGEILQRNKKGGVSIWVVGAESQQYYLICHA